MYKDPSSYICSSKKNYNCLTRQDKEVFIWARLENKRRGQDGWDMPVNKLVSPTWLLHSTEKFWRFTLTLHYREDCTKYTTVWVSSGLQQYKFIRWCKHCTQQLLNNNNKIYINNRQCFFEWIRKRCSRVEKARPRSTRIAFNHSWYRPTDNESVWSSCCMAVHRPMQSYHVTLEEVWDIWTIAHAIINNVMK